MPPVNERDLDLNLLRVFFAVAETGSVTAAARKLYLTQPALSAALKRLGSAVGAPLFARQGRGLVLTARGARLAAAGRPHLDALVRATLSPAVFDAATSDRVVRLGLADANDAWLLPPLLGRLAAEAPRMRLVVVPVQFRTVGDALARGSIDLAVTVADELPAGIERRSLFTGGFVVLFDPRHARVGRAITLARYLEHEHVIVSYNGDLHGLVEDLLGVRRKVRISIGSFHGIGGIVEGSALLATVPTTVARVVRELRPRLRTAALPFALGATPLELLSRSALSDDEAVAFVRDHVVRIASALPEARGGRG